MLLGGNESAGVYRAEWGDVSEGARGAFAALLSHVGSLKGGEWVFEKANTLVISESKQN